MAEVVDGLTWTRSKPDLRMYREMFGMSTASSAVWRRWTAGR